ncbi:MAG: YciI family protein [Telluria sp.]
MWKRALFAVCALLFCAARPALAQGAAPAGFDPELAKTLGADEHGMRNYVLVILKTGPHPVPDGEARNKMFEGHMANIRRRAAEKKLVAAGPLDGVDGWRGLFVFATPDIEEARRLVGTDPVITSGEMVAEFHKFYGSAGLMMLNEIHGKIEKK